MQDKLEKTGNGTLIQHGKSNDRVYLMKLHPGDCPDIIQYMAKLAEKHHYTKLFAKVPGWAAPYFISAGYMMEAYIPAFYRLSQPAFFLSRFLSTERSQGVEQDKLAELTKMLQETDPATGNPGSVPDKTPILKLESRDASEITEVYKKVFLSYPFPIHQPRYIRETMENHVLYFGIREQGQLIAVASAETDPAGANAEMTDFATLPQFRGRKLAQRLLSAMEEKMNETGITTLYTIARLNSMAMNKTFLNLGYTWSGTLVRNTNIAGRIESMNVYYKHINQTKQ